MNGKCAKLQRMYSTSALEEHAYSHVHTTQWHDSSIFEMRESLPASWKTISQKFNILVMFHVAITIAMLHLSLQLKDVSFPKLLYGIVIKHHLCSNDLMTAQYIESSHAALFLLQVVIQACYPRS